MEKLRIVVGGFIGLYPTGGATWDYMQYPLGLKLLGHEVYYIEDTMLYPVFQLEGKSWDDATLCVNYVKTVMESIGLAGQWAYRDVASGTSYGMSEQQIKQVCKSADVFINISCSTHLRDEYLAIPKRVLIDSDPMFTQIQYHNELEGLLGSSTKFMLDNHNFLFTFGENIHSEDCRIPTFNYKWFTTRQPVCIELWNQVNSHLKYHFSSVMNWSGRKKLKFINEEWGQKDIEFEKFMEVPKKFPEAKFEVVINPPRSPESRFNPSEIESAGWKVLNPHTTVANPYQYKKFIQQSMAEFSVAKETYVKSGSGWFSCRSACYLAAGKPVITQDTKWSAYIPSGLGLLAFTDMESVMSALEEVTSEVEKHAKAAREIATEYFDSSMVLTKMLQQINQ